MPRDTIGGLYAQLKTTAERRSVMKLLRSMVNGDCDNEEKSKVCKKIRRSAPRAGAAKTSGHIQFYKDKYPGFREAMGADAKLSDVAKRAGAEWKALTDSEKDVDNKLAKEKKKMMTDVSRDVPPTKKGVAQKKKKLLPQPEKSK